MFRDLPSGPAAPSGTPGDVLAALLRMLADVTRRKADTLDPGQPFTALGLDSLLGVEFVATVNAYFGTDIKAAAVLDHATPAHFARHVAGEVRSEPTAPPAAAPAAPPPAPALPVADVLREELARVLVCEPWDLDADTPFRVLGVDSLVGAEYMAVVNRVYGLRERAVVLHDHPTLAALAGHIGALVAPRLPDGAPVPSAVVADPAPGPTMSLDDLLDAVRDDRVSLDDAVALLPRLG
ncbi:acyl carrier protein [Streptomyces sp. BYX5S]